MTSSEDIRRAARDVFGHADLRPGQAEAIEAAVDRLRRGGRLLVFGVSPADAVLRLSPFRIYNDELTVVGSMAVLHSYRAALDLVASGAVRVSCTVIEKGSFGFTTSSIAKRTPTARSRRRSAACAAAPTTISPSRSPSTSCTPASAR